MSVKSVDTQALTTVARLYYERDLTKQEIARRLGVSRFKVARLLERARDEGVVRFEFRDAVPSAATAVAELERRFALDAALVARTEDLAPAAAGLVSAFLDDRSVLGVSWGATIAAVATALAPVGRDVPVVQICGAVPGLEPGTSPTEVAIRAAERLGGTVFALPAPAFSSRAARDELLGHAALRPAVERFDDVTLALVGIGRRGAGGHVLVHAFDRDGVIVETEMAERSIALSLLPPRKPRVLAVAAGAGKESAIRGALRAGLVDVLVTDEAGALAALS